MYFHPGKGEQKFMFSFSSSDAPLIFLAVKCSERYKYLASERIGKGEIFPQCFLLVLFTSGKDGKSNYIGGEKLMEILSMSAKSWKLKASKVNCNISLRSKRR